MNKLLIALVTVISLVGCGKKEEAKTETTTTTTTTASVPANTATATANTATMESAPAAESMTTPVNEAPQATEQPSATQPADAPIQAQ